MNNNSVYNGLQGLALALIFCPEPITTIVGVWLLGYARAKANGKEATPPKRENSFAHIYDYRLQKVGEAVLIYELEERRSGQLPWPTMTTKVYKLPQSWKAYQNGDSQPARPQLLNGAPLPTKKARTSSGARQTVHIKQPHTSAPLAELYRLQPAKKPEPLCHSKSFSVMQRDHIARMLESMRYIQSLAAASSRRSST